MNVSVGTITRLTLLVLALINQFLTMSGHSPIQIDDATMTDFISYGAVVVTAVIAAWKNNSVTKDAVRADEYLKQLRNSK